MRNIRRGRRSSTSRRRSISPQTRAMSDIHRQISRQERDRLFQWYDKPPTPGMPEPSPPSRIGFFHAHEWKKTKDRTMPSPTGAIYRECLYECVRCKKLVWRDVKIS